jgi:hypothetical protein
MVVGGKRRKGGVRRARRRGVDDQFKVGWRWRPGYTANPVWYRRYTLNNVWIKLELQLASAFILTGSRNRRRTQRV